MDDEGFLRAMLASPEDEAPRLVYADWLEERSDSRSEFLRTQVEIGRRRTANKPVVRLEKQLDKLRDAIDPAWISFMTTLGQPFRIGPQDRSFFDCEPSHLPFTESIGLRGQVMTFANQFRGEKSWQPGLPEDLQLLCALQLGGCASGAGSMPVHPFICEFGAKGKITGAAVLKALRTRNFSSRYIRDLNAERIAFPGYHPGDGTGTYNDEIHNDFTQQFIFPRTDEDDEVVDEFSGAHGALKRAVVNGQLWYVLLHITPQEMNGFLFSNYVVLLGVGLSSRGNRLIGVVTHQVCHNLCD